MIYKVTFHLSTLYIYIYTKFHQLKNYHKKQEKLIHEFILYRSTRNFLHKLESKYYIMGSVNEDKQ